MAKKIKSASDLGLIYNGFSGMDANSSHGGGGICDMANFRVTADGSITKRSGYRAIYSTSKEIRAIWSGYIDGKFVCYFLADRSVFTLDVKTGEATLQSTIQTETGKAQFFYLRDSLYLIDGKNIYKISGIFAPAVKGYVPLLGKDWDVGLPGPINEPLNPLTRRARITYKVGESVSAYLPTMYPVETIDALYKNGELVDPDDYSFDTRFNTINLSGLETGDELEANVTFSEDEEYVNARADILSSTCATVFGGINNSRLFLWGGNIKNKIFTTTYVSRDSLNSSNARYTNSGHIYFRPENDFVVGDGRYNVKAVVRHFDRLLILTDGDAWIADSAACGIEEFPVMSINSNIGCYSDCGAVLAGNDPISIGRHAIFRWTSDTDELNESNAFSISDAVSPMLDNSFFANARIFCDKKRSEIWFCDPSGDGNAWIYNYELKYWFRFSNIRAESFFDADGEVGFISDGSFYVFDPELFEDIYTVDNTSGETVIASFDSSICDLGISGYKKLSYVVCSADTQGSSIDITMITDRGEVIDLSMSSQEDHDIILRRVHSHRLKSFDIKLRAGGKSAQTIHSLKIEAR
jgi:hypothetical protein